MARATAALVRVRTARPTKNSAAAVVKRTRRVTKKTVSRAPAEDTRYGGISSAAVKTATGRTWEQWLSVLDKSGAKEMTHKEIARLLADRFACPPWWSQMVTVGYEQARGKREKHQVAGGYSVSGSRIVDAPIAMLYEAWADRALRSRWLGAADLHIRTATPNKSMRITWDPAKSKGSTNLEVLFYDKGPGRSQVTVQHSKLRSAAAGQKMKKFWKERLDALKASLEA
jgi:uncharacterized protein YndB with AHSA1/START domain